jgi:hypothetical protein
MDKFEIIIYDTTFLTASGNNVIDVQYRSANRWNSSTVGIEDPTNTIAINCLYNDTLHRGCANWAPRKVIRYTSGRISDIIESENKTQSVPLISLFPNPFRNQIKISWTIAKPSQVRLNIYDYSGRLVRTLSDNYGRQPGSYSVIWNGKDNAGKIVGHGVYFIRLETDQEVMTVKTINLR